MMLALNSGPKMAAKVGNPAGLLCQRIWYSVGKSGVLGITEYRQGRPLKTVVRQAMMYDAGTCAVKKAREEVGCGGNEDVKMDE